MARFKSIALFLAFILALQFVQFSGVYAQDAEQAPQKVDDQPVDQVE